jgi:hypothetical protein
MRMFGEGTDVDLALGDQLEALLSNQNSELYTVQCPEYDMTNQTGCLHFFDMSAAAGRVFLGCGGNPKKNMRVRVECR